MSLFESASLCVTPNGTKASKLYAVKPTDGSGDLTVTRATTATRVNSAGLIESVASNVPRLDYTNSTCPSILVEPQRTNLLLRSEEFDNISWIKSSSNVTSNATTAPDGTTTADKLTEDNTNANHLIQQVIVASNASYTFSVFAKKAERNWVVLRSVNASFQNVKAWFNIDAGTIGTLENGATAKITNFSNGWYKLEMTIPSYSTGFEFRISTSTGNGVDSYTGTTGNGVYLWGGQLEAGSYATSYIPTTSSSVTRNADVISKTGISSLIGQTEGTMFVDFYNEGNANYNPCSINAGGYENAVYFEMYLNNMYGVIWNGAAQQFIFNAGSLSIGRHKMAIAYKLNDIAFYIDGVLKATDTNATIPSCSRVDVGNIASNSSSDLSKTNDMVLWKTRLTNAELATLTTI